jgi:TnpA family transposase
VLKAICVLRDMNAENARKISWLQAWHVRDETYSKALAELVNTQSRHPFAGYWGDGTTSSSDGQRFKVGGKAESTGHINPKYGAEPGRTFYTHLSDQFAPYHAKAVNVPVRARKRERRHAPRRGICGILWKQ